MRKPSENTDGDAAPTQREARGRNLFVYIEGESLRLHDLRYDHASYGNTKYEREVSSD